jgi:sarcosine oxidase subunit gamma
MAEYTRRRSSLAEAYREGSFGADTTTPGVTFAERRPLEMVQVATWSAVASIDGVAPPSKPNTASRGETATILWTGPGRWLVVRPAGTEPDLAARLRATIAPDAASVIDLGQSRAVVRVSGPHARDVLAKGTGLDLHPRAFPAGACAQTVLGHINALLHAVDDAPAIDVYVARSFALTFWEWLTEAAGEYGYRVDGTVL